MSEARDIPAWHAQTAAELVPEVGMEGIAEVYAQALLGAAEKLGQSAQTLADLEAVVAEVLTPFPSFEAVLVSARVPHEEKLGIIERVFAGRVGELTLNFLKVLSRRGRLDCLRAIQRRLRILHDQLQGRVQVQISTATAVAPELAVRVQRRLRAALGREPVVTHQIDPDLIGGMVIRVGDTLYDGSVANQLKLARQQIIKRSAHEIQSRRDRFCDPAGD